jgi:hypothetical protein
MKRGADLGLALVGAWLTAFALTAGAQAGDVPRAPRILPVPGAPAPDAAATSPAPVPTHLPRVTRPPNAARLAPLPTERGDAPDEIVVIGEGWRLPDLGSEWRARQREQALRARFNATALPLYDPNDPPYRSERSLSSPEERRHGYIELFRLRFGRRSTD